jgi:hypothetical protein
MAVGTAEMSCRPCYGKTDVPYHHLLLLLLSLAPQPSLSLGLLHKIRLNFLEASQQFPFYRVGLLAPRQTPIPEDQTSVFISPRGRTRVKLSAETLRIWYNAWLLFIRTHSYRMDIRLREESSPNAAGHATISDYQYAYTFYRRNITIMSVRNCRGYCGSPF